MKTSSKYLNVRYYKDVSSIKTIFFTFYYTVLFAACMFLFVPHTRCSGSATFSLKPFFSFIKNLCSLQVL
ncbi:hypothetical protein RJT34_18720 [Clitoria ternatea]|uniref:Uncharacterized protein n=1 Tax=Clitoria ternatea TaxID=43366 RepID=A0AAN9JBQ1_CLITE